MGVDIQKHVRPDEIERAHVRRLFLVSRKHALAVLADAMDRRATSATFANSESSRSHFIVMLKIERVINKSGRRVDIPKGKKLTSTLFLVDLAGTEEAWRAHTESEQFSEGVSTNTDLHHLGQMVSFRAKSGGKGFIPSKNCKVTNNIL